MITDQNRDAIYAAIRTKVEALNGIVHALNGMEDHIHLLATVPPSLELAAFMKQIKGSTSHLASRLTDDYDPFHWQADYGVHTVSESHVPHIINYIRNQQQHHADRTIDPRLESD